MSMLLKCILLTFMVTAYVVINPSTTCYNDCETTFESSLISSPPKNASTAQTHLESANSPLILKPTLNGALTLNEHSDDLTAPPTALPKHKSQRDIVEGGIEGTGKIGNSRELFEFNDEPLTPEEVIQQNSEAEEDGIEGTGRMALGSEHLIAYGPISRFGSIYVNGIKYETDKAQVEFIHEQQLNQLSVGMMVKVKAHWDPQADRIFHAQKVWFDQQAKGPAQDITQTSFGTQLSILGTTIYIDEETVLDNLTLKNIKAGNVLSISGITDADNHLLATYVSRRSHALNSNQSVEIEATVLSLNANQQRIIIKGIEIDSTHAKWTNSNLNNVKKGDLIEVLGTFNSHAQQLNATSITLKAPNLNLQTGNKFSVDAIISSYQSKSHFILNGQLSDASKAEYLTGTASILANKIRIKANGKINKLGIFIIRTIEIIQPTNASIKTTINSVNAATGEIMLLGVTAKTKPGTLFQSKLSNANQFFSINDLSPGDWVELKGKWSEGTLNLNTVNAIDPANKQVLKGQIEKSDSGKITILGINILTNALLSNTQIQSLKSGDFLLAKGEMLDAETFNAVSIFLE